MSAGEAPAPRRSALARLAGPLREFGVAAGLLYIADRALRALSPRCGLLVYEMVAQPVPEQPLLPPRLARTLSSREIVHGDPEVAAMAARPEIKEQRFAQGARCIGAWRNGVLVGYAWFCFGRYEEDEARLSYLLPEAGTAFDFDVVVLPEHRLGLGFPSVWDVANAFLRQHGVRWSLSRVTRFNEASRKAHGRLGARVLSRVAVLRLGRLEVTVATQRPRLSLTWSRRVPLALAPPASPATP